MAKKGTGNRKIKSFWKPEKSDKINPIESEKIPFLPVLLYLTLHTLKSLINLRLAGVDML